MSNEIHWGGVWESIIAFIFVSILGFLGWLWKNSIYGKMAEQKKDTDEKIDRVEKNIQQKVTESLCESFRAGCTNAIKNRLDGMDEKIDHVIKSQDSLTERIDKLFLTKIP